MVKRTTVQYLPRKSSDKINSVDQEKNHLLRRRQWWKHLLNSYDNGNVVKVPQHLWLFWFARCIFYFAGTGFNHEILWYACLLELTDATFDHPQNLQNQTNKCSTCRGRSTSLPECSKHHKCLSANIAVKRDSNELRLAHRPTHPTSEFQPKTSVDLQQMHANCVVHHQKNIYIHLSHTTKERKRVCNSFVGIILLIKMIKQILHRLG